MVDRVGKDRTEWNSIIDTPGAFSSVSLSSLIDGCPCLFEVASNKH